MDNKVKYGLKNTYYAVVTEANGVVSYGTPKPVPGSVNLTLSAAGENVTFYADDQVYYEENVNNGYDGSLEMALVSDDFRVDVLGEIIDENGAIGENANATIKKFALMFEFDGDQKKTRHVLYSVLPTRPNIDGSTKTNTKEPKTETMNIAVKPAFDTSDVKWRVLQGDAGYDTFFSAVYLKNAPTNTVAASTGTFSKASPTDLSINVTSTDATNSAKNVLMDGLPIGGIHLTATGVDVTIADDYLATLVNGTHVITIEFVKGNAVTVTLTVTA
jgi:phage major tail protein, phi13 family